MPPAAVATSSSIFHLSPPAHASSDLPSNSTFASLGTPPGGTGSITGGSGHTMPLLYSCVCQATAETAKRITSTARRDFEFIVVAVVEEHSSGLRHLTSQLSYEEQRTVARSWPARRGKHASTSGSSGYDDGREKRR